MYLITTLLLILAKLLFATCLQNDAFDCKVHYLSSFQDFKQGKEVFYSLNVTLKESTNSSSGHFCGMNKSPNWPLSDLTKITCKQKQDVLIQLPADVANYGMVSIILNCSAAFPLDVNASGNLTVGYVTTSFRFGNIGKTKYWLAVEFPHWPRSLTESYTIAGMYSFYSKLDTNVNTRVKLEMNAVWPLYRDQFHWRYYGDVLLSWDRLYPECKSVTMSKVYFANIAGEHPRHTEILQPCLYEGNECKGKLTGDNKGYFDSYKILENFHPHGAIACTSLTQQVIVSYFTAVDLTIQQSESAFWNEQYLIRMGLSEMVKLNTLYQPKIATFFANDVVEFECFKVDYILNSPFTWSAISSNVTKVLSPIQPDRKYVTELVKRRGGNLMSDYTISFSKTQVKVTEDLVAVKCSAVFWNSSDAFASSVQKLRIIKQSLSSSPRFCQNETSHDVGIEKSVDLSCEAQNAFPWPTYRWEYLSGFLNKSSPEVTWNITSSLNGYVSILKIYNVSAHHAGKFVCVANNSGGEARQYFNVSVRPEAKPYVYFAVAAALVGILSIAVIILIRLYYRQRGRLTAAEIKLFENGNEQSLSPGSVNHENAQYMPYNRDYEVKWKDIHISDDKLGEGEYGIVFKGYLKRDPNTPVAIKTTKFGVEKQIILALLSELKILIYLGKHENLVELKGACTEFLRDGRVYVIFEYCPMGNLETHLHDKKLLYAALNDQDHGNTCESSSIGHYSSIHVGIPMTPLKKCLDHEDLLKWSIQIANGMRYLSDNKVIHGDLATRNILLSNNMQVKITDFGLSSKLVNYQTYTKNDRAKLPWRWLPPETLKTCKFTGKSDVWSFGITLWEIFSLGDLPYSGLQWSSDFALYLESNLRLSKPEFASESIYKLMCKCWTVDPSMRPDFESLEMEIQACCAV